MRDIGIGLIGTGFMGKCHALAYRAVRAVFGDVPTPRLETLCETPRDKAEEMAGQFGFARATDDWRRLVEDPAVDVVAIATPNRLHCEIALAALAAGKHVHCEKPLAVTLDDAERMADAARAAGTATIVGYNYIHNPAFAHAQSLVREGVIGRIVHFRGVVDEDYQADPALPWTWRSKKAEAGLGALGDLGCHLVSIACGLAGPVASLVADMETVHRTRPLPDGTGEGAVENEDVATAMVRFENGVLGTLATSRSAWGRKNRLAFEVHGDRGAIVFDQERMNEFRIFENAGPQDRQGFRTILTGPAHPPYDAFCPAAGHGLGFNDLKVIEVAHFLHAIASGVRPHPDFQAALAFERVIHAIVEASETGQRVVMPQSEYPRV